MIVEPRSRAEGLENWLNCMREKLPSNLSAGAFGRVKRLAGVTVEAVGCELPVSGRCTIERQNGSNTEAEVVGFDDDRLVLMALDGLEGIAPNSRVWPLSSDGVAQVGDGLIGRVVDGAGMPLDGLGPLERCKPRPLSGVRLNPLERGSIRRPLDVGVRSINALLSLGVGQRVGLFAGPGVGKSVLLGMMTRFTDADVVVVGLIGERGREVPEFIDENLGPQGMARSVVVAAPADSSPLLRLQGAALATAIAEHFRDQGKRVLLLIDSLTRYAQAQREIGLAVGELPATRGFPSSVFGLISRLVERAGNHGSSGSITAVYTVLTEGDPDLDPVAESARAVLDGHIVLSREMSDRGTFPAVDIESSVSRVMNKVVNREHEENSRRFRELFAVFNRNRDFINAGAYVPGSDPTIDLAIRKKDEIQAFMLQDSRVRVDWDASVAALNDFCLGLDAQDV